MHQTAIFSPMFVMVVLTIVVWAYMYLRRIPFLTASGIDPNEITPARLAEISPPAVANPSDNLKNLFEIPVLFYVTCLYLFVTQQVDSLHLYAAWAFVCLRILHSIIHCTVNIVMVRFGIYFLSCVALFVMIGRSALAHLGA